jgi:hypothetical protein
MRLTAVAGNGILPCYANVRTDEESRILGIYPSPRIAENVRTRNIVASEETILIVTEWIVNEYGVWYRILDPVAQQNTGYVRAEDLILAEDCPR